MNLKDKNRVQSSTKDLLLEVEAILPLSKCADALSDFVYHFICSKKASDGSVSVCSDPSGIFNKNQSSNTLTVPKSYFTNGDTLTINVTVSTSDEVKTDGGYFEIISDDTVILRTTCTIPYCKYFIPDQDIYFKVSPVDSNVKYDYNWTIVPTLTSSEFLAVTSNLLIKVQTGLSGYVRVIAEIVGSTTKGKQELILPVNNPPRSGNFTLSKTNLFWLEDVRARMAGWIDEDLPLRYQVIGPDGVPYSTLGYDTEYKISMLGNKTAPTATLALSF